ncbi:MAG TPA: hypothetical protein VEJ20_00320, partial [Candidatus Eremiobacteraceae bacterium]|nr:hypothetical protein [Candidatus Eremiobacteraceae bacterium]
EDYGEAQLVDGAATVALDPAFAKSISDRQPYLVFVTPDGPSRGLYVAQKSLEGFTVRENPGGTSTIAFDYRIVAKPANDDRPRMSLSPRPLAVVRLPAVPVRPSLAPSRAIAVAAVRRLEAAQRAGIRAHRQLPQRMPLYEPRIGQDGKLHPGQTYVPKPHG